MAELKEKLDFALKRMVVSSIPNWQFSSNQKYHMPLYNKASLEHCSNFMSSG